MNRAIDLYWTASAGTGVHADNFSANADWNPRWQARQRVGG